MSDLNPQPLPPGGQTIRVTAPASVLNDLSLFHTALSGVLERAGCPTCTSGINFLWQAETQFTVNHQGKVV
jgi:hypothetical protein